MQEVEHSCELHLPYDEVLVGARTVNIRNRNAASELVAVMLSSRPGI